MECVQLKVNMNAQVQVVLTKYGAETLNKHYSQFDTFGSYQNLNEGDAYKTELWQIMQIFGEGIYMGMPQAPFEGNVIEFV